MVHSELLAEDRWSDVHTKPTVYKQHKLRVIALSVFFRTNKIIIVTTANNTLI